MVRRSSSSTTSLAKSPMPNLQALRRALRRYGSAQLLYLGPVTEEYSLLIVRRRHDGVVERYIPPIVLAKIQHNLLSRWLKSGWRFAAQRTS